MAARTPPPGLQLTWLDGELLAWQPARGAYGGNLQQEVAAVARRRSLAYGGRTRLVPLRLPDGELKVMCQTLDAAALAALAELDLLRAEVSPSVAWFAGLARYSLDLVRHGRVLPTLVHLGTSGTRSEVWQAGWRPVETDIDAVHDLLGAMPPVVAAGGPVQPHELLHVLVDRVTRVSLRTHAWHPELNDTHSSQGRAMRMISRALVADVGHFQVGDDLGESVAAAAQVFGALERRSRGEPLLRGRLRLGMPGVAVPVPDDPYDDHAHVDDADEAADGRWPLVLELVDVDDRGRWCTADDVLGRRPAAMLVAGVPTHMAILAESLDRTIAAVVDAVPELADWSLHERAAVSVDVAAAVLESIDLLDTAGVELIAPERLVRRRTSTRAMARPTESTGSGRFTSGALVDWSAVVDGEEVPDEVLRRAAEDGATLVEVGGRWVQLDRAEARRALANLERHRATHGEMSALELLVLAAELERELLAAGVEVDEVSSGSGVHATGWLDRLLRGLPDESLGDGVVPEGFTATLRPYQLRGLGWLQFLQRLGLGGCLADDMGLGKTPTTLAHLAGVPGPHLVVCPLSVVRNWESEAERFTPGLRTMVHHGTGRADADEFVREAAVHDVVITTYQVAARDLDTVQRVDWSTLVLDEAQAVKNPDTRTARAMRGIAARQRLALTGTPVENRLTELWSIFQVVAPGLLGNATQFRNRFVGPIEREHDEAATQELRRITAPFLLRRTKADRSLVPDLPDKVEQIAWASLTREQAHMYQAVVDQLLADAQAATGMRRRGLVLAALTRLKQICNHPAHALGDGSRLAGRSGKLQRFDELVTDLLDAGEQALVFTQFKEMGLLLQQHLRERFGQEVPFLHGGVARAQRDRMVQQFQHGTAPSPLLLVSLRAGGVGLNLTAASRVVHYDRWWNPAVEDQATDRVWRIGQTQSVFVHKLVCEGTVEERIDALINDKRRLADAVVGTTGEAWLSELSTDDLRDLVVLDHRTVRS